MSGDFLDLEQLNVPVNWSSEGNLHIHWLVLEAVFVVVIPSIVAGVGLVVSRSRIVCAIGRVCVIFFFSLINRIIILTLVAEVPDMCFIYFKLVVPVADINLVDLIKFPCVDTLLGDDLGLQTHGFLKSYL